MNPNPSIMTPQGSLKLYVDVESRARFIHECLLKNLFNEYSCMQWQLMNENRMGLNCVDLDKNKIVIRCSQIILFLSRNSNPDSHDVSKRARTAELFCYLIASRFLTAGQMATGNQFDQFRLPS